MKHALLATASLCCIAAVAYLVFAAGTYMFFEPELADAAAASTTVSLTVNSEITLTCDATTTLIGTINAMTGGTATSSFSCLVSTPDSSGYNLVLKQDDLLKTGAGGANLQFNPMATTTPFAYDYPAPGDGVETYGFSLESTTASPVAAFMEDTGTCGSGAVSTGHCWNSFSQADYKVASKGSAAAGGEAVDVQIRAQAGAANSLMPGLYQNIITSTATVGP